MLLHSTSGRRCDRASSPRYGAELKTLHGVGSVAAPALSADRPTADYPVTLSYDPASTRRWP